MSWRGLLSALRCGRHSPRPGSHSPVGGLAPGGLSEAAAFSGAAPGTAGFLAQASSPRSCRQCCLWRPTRCRQLLTTPRPCARAPPRVPAFPARRRRAARVCMNVASAALSDAAWGPPAPAGASLYPLYQPRVSPPCLRGPACVRVCPRDQMPLPPIALDVTLKAVGTASVMSE